MRQPSGGGRPVAHVTRELGISRQTASRRAHRYIAKGATGLCDRSSRPHASPTLERVISDGAFAHRNATVFKAAIAELGAVQKFIKPYCPWANGNIAPWPPNGSDRCPDASSTERAHDPDPWLTPLQQ